MSMQWKSRTFSLYKAHTVHVTSLIRLQTHARTYPTRHIFKETASPNPSRLSSFFYLAWANVQRHYFQIVFSSPLLLSRRFCIKVHFVHRKMVPLQSGRYWGQITIQLPHWKAVCLFADCCSPELLLWKGSLFSLPLEVGKLESASRL